MIGHYAVVAARIRQELNDIEPLVGRAERHVELARASHDPDPFLDGAALNVHGFYTRLERIFYTIARDVDKSIPSGPEWHRDLLNQMTLEMSGVRPAVIRRETADELEEYLGFRHVVRSLYTTRLKPDRIQELAGKARAAMTKARAELLAFADFLEGMARADETPSPSPQ